MRGKRCPAGESLETWGIRTARETGDNAGNLRSLAYRSRGVRVSNETAARWARTARVPGMRLHINMKRPTEPWGRTDCGHTVTREVGNGATVYTVTSAWWESPIRFTASGRHGLARLAQILGPFALFIDGVYADDEDESEQYDSEGMEPLPLFSGRVAA